MKHCGANGHLTEKEIEILADSLYHIMDIDIEKFLKDVCKQNLNLTLGCAIENSYRHLMTSSTDKKIVKILQKISMR